MDKASFTPGKRLRNYGTSPFFAANLLFLYSYTQMLHGWNMWQHLPHRWPKCIGKYTIHGVYGTYVTNFQRVTSGTWTDLFWLDFIRPRDPLRIPGWRVVGGEAKGCYHSTGRDQVGPEISSGLIFFTFSIWKMVILCDFQNPTNIGTSKGSSILNGI